VATATDNPNVIKVKELPANPSAAALVPAAMVSSTVWSSSPLADEDSSPLHTYPDVPASRRGHFIARTAGSTEEPNSWRDLHRWELFPHGVARSRSSRQQVVDPGRDRECSCPDGPARHLRPDQQDRA
jgi:hypothetical protein